MILLSVEDSIDRAALAGMGFDGHMTKPVKQSRLFDAIMDAIGRARQGLAGTTRQSPSSPIPATPSARPVLPAAVNRGNVRILVAEDNEINRIVVGEILARAGYPIDVVNDGKQAVEALERNRYQLVLMDCQMPIMDGFEATRAIRQKEAGGRRIPIIALTANAMKGDRELCLEAGMDAYASKPIDPNGLLEAIEEMLTKNSHV